MAQTPTSIIADTQAALGTFVFDGYEALIDELSLSFQALLFIFTVLLGFAMMYSRIEMPTKDAFILFAKAVFVYILFTQWAYYDQFIFDVFFNGPEELANLILGVKSSDISSLQTDLDIIFYNGFEAAKIVREQGGLTSTGPLLYSFLIILATLLMIGFVTFLIVIAKLGVAILLVIGPIFICMLLFNSTRGLFQSWLAYLINYALIPVLIYTMFILIKIMVFESVNSMINANVDITMAQIAPYLLVSMVSFLLFTQVIKLAKSIGEGILNFAVSLPTKFSVSLQSAQTNFNRYSTRNTETNINEKKIYSNPPMGFVR